MEIPQIIVFAVILLAMTAFVREWLPIELTALLAAGVLWASGIIGSGDLFGGFSNPATVTIACMFVISAALERTGVIDSLGHFLIRHAKGSLRRTMLLILLVPLPLSAFINNTPIVVILLPAVLAMSRAASLAPSKLLIPLSYATILGGVCTKVGTSTNLIVDGIVRDRGMEGFTLFSVAPLGLVFVVVGLTYILVLGPKLLPNRETLSSILTPEMRREYLLQASVPKDSAYLGKRLGDLLKNEFRGTHILEVRRRGFNLNEDLSEILLKRGDRLLIRTGSKGVQSLRAKSGVKLGFQPIFGLKKMEEREAVIMEGIIGPNSRFTGKTLRNLHFRQRYGVIILAIHREGRNVTHNLESLRLEFGDTLLVEGAKENIARLLEERGFINLSEPREKAPNRRKAPLALLAMGAFILGGAFGLNTAPLAFLCALWVTITGCITPSEAYESVDWKILLLIIGMLAVGRAMDTSGSAVFLASHLSHWIAPLGAVALLSALYLLTSVLTEMVSNAAVAALLTPVAISMAESIDKNPLPFIIAVMFGASASFATPIGYQTNTYVYGAGGYRFKDFLRIGLPLNIILWLTATCVIPLIWPL